MFAISSISTMKVEADRPMSSEEPMRVKIRSTTPMRASLAGTKDPICARSTRAAVCRIQVDFPAMFGPVRIVKSRSDRFMRVSYGTKGSPESDLSTTGCLPSTILIASPSSIAGAT
jgi:hypothetical protein